MSGQADGFVSHNSTRERVAVLRAQGLGTIAIARELGVAKSTVAYHLRRMGEAPDRRFLRRYDWTVIQAYYDEGHTKQQCQERFGFSSETWHSAVKRGALRTRPRAMPIDELLSRRRNRVHLKLRLIAAGLKDGRCEDCGVSTWRDRPLSLQVHHVNGDGHDNRLENLRLLCPNCHSQTENWGGRNVKRAPHGRP